MISIRKIRGKNLKIKNGLLMLLLFNTNNDCIYQNFEISFFMLNTIVVLLQLLQLL